MSICPVARLIIEAANSAISRFRQGVFYVSKTSVTGVFEDRSRAEKALEALKQRGFTEREVSVVGRDEGRNGGNREDADGGVGRGAAWGAGIGAAAGILATAGALAVPGIGPLLAAGPIATALGGAATGGVAGALVDWGIPEEEGRQYEQDIKQGRFLAVVEAGEDRANQAAKTLREYGASKVKEHDRDRAAAGARR